MRALFRIPHLCYLNMSCSHQNENLILGRQFGPKQSKRYFSFVLMADFSEFIFAKVYHISAV